MAHAEEQCVFIVGKLDLLRFRCGEQLLQLLQSFARNQHPLLAADALESFVCLLYERQPVPVSRHHRQRLRLDHQQRAVQRIARLLIRNGKNSARNQRLQRQRRNARSRDCGELRDLWVVGARHAHHLGV